MSHKGKTFTHDDLPQIARQRWTQEQKDAWCREHTERYRIIYRDPDTGVDIIAEELEQRIINKCSPKAKRVVGAMMGPAMTDELRREVLAAFEPSGKLKNPFTPYP